MSPPLKAESPPPATHGRRANQNSQGLAHPTSTTTDYSGTSRQVAFWPVYEYVQGLLADVGSYPMLGTPEWCSMSDADLRKLASLYDAAVHWALRVQTCQEVRAEASRDISAAADWPQIATEIAQLNSFRADNPWTKRVAS